MKSKKNRYLWSLVFILSGCFFQCTPTKVVVKDEKVAKKQGCIFGRVINDEQKNLSGVEVNTKPETDITITGKHGFFSICHKRHINNDGASASTLGPIKSGTYTIQLKKEGYHARPKIFKYSGKKVIVGKMLMVLATRPLPTVISNTKKEDKKLDNVVKGPKEWD